MLDRIVANIYETHTLVALRDALLPKLISVELRVDVEDTMNMPHDARVG